MPLYDLLKFVHIGFAIGWLGGAMALTLLVAHLRRQDPAEALGLLGRVPFVAARLFGPGGMGAVTTGLVLGWLGGWFWSAWIVVSLVLVVGLILLGARVLDPMAQRATALRGAGEGAAGPALLDRFVRIATLDLTVQWAVVSLMVLKPGWGDPLLAVPAAILVAGAILSRRRLASPVPLAA